MASLNKVQLIGNLGRDPETRYLPDGGAITTISVATTDKWKDKDTQEQKEKTEWHRIVFFGKLAEIAGEYLKKGSQVYLEGKLTHREYEKDGEKKWITEVVCNQMQMLGSRENSGGGGESRGSREGASKPAGDTKPAAKAGARSSKFDDFEDDIPF